MSQFLINVLAWLLLHAGISIPEIREIETIGFNLAVPCQFDFRSESVRPCDVPAVNRREQLRGVMFVFELPAATVDCPIQDSIAEAPVSIESLVPIIPAVSSMVGSGHHAVISIGDCVQEIAMGARELVSRSVIKLVHPLNSPLASFSAVKPPSGSLFEKYDLNRFVQRVYSVTTKFSLHSTDSSDPYWTYFQDCDRWGVVLMSLDIQSSQATATVNIDEVIRSVSKQIQLACRILVPGTVEADLLRSNRETLKEVACSAVEWWKMVVFEGVKPSISRALQLPMSWR